MFKWSSHCTVINIGLSYSVYHHFYVRKCNSREDNDIPLNVVGGFDAWVQDVLNQTQRWLHDGRSTLYKQSVVMWNYSFRYWAPVQTQEQLNSFSIVFRFCVAWAWEPKFLFNSYKRGGSEVQISTFRSKWFPFRKKSFQFPAFQWQLCL